MHGVRFLKGVRLVQLAQGHSSPGEEVHGSILDPRKQQIVGRPDGAAQIGQQEVQSASHAGSPPFRNTTADRSYAAALPKSSRPCRDAVKSPPKLARQSLANVSAARGKYGLHRAGCWVTPRRRKATKRATETSRGAAAKAGVQRVKRGNLHPEQHQIGGRRRGSPSPRVDGSSPGATSGLEE